MPKLRFFNTLTRSVEDFTPAREDGIVRLYTCGPTVYDYLHVGNYRTYIFEDVLKRTLKLFGLPVRHVMNITDVGHLTSDADEGEDKLELGAKREGKTAWDIARFYEQTFIEDIKKLNIDFAPEPDPAREDAPRAADILCRATDHINEQAAMVDRLVLNRFTYDTADGIYFDTSMLPDYGKLAGAAHIAGLQEGARVAMGEKRNSTDFALWKFSPKGEQRQMEWEYRGRKGFPGWHIECSSMGQTYLGESFDIHCGGVDHIPIHHTNEIAQAEAATGKPFVRCWMHAEFLIMNKAKMAKSAGGFIKLADLEEKRIDPLDYRYFCFGAHYRKQLEFSWEGLQAARTARRRLRDRVRGWLAESAAGVESAAVAQARRDFSATLADDLNVPEALACVYGVLDNLGSAGERIAFLREAEKVLALGLFAAAKEECLPGDVQRAFEDYVAARRDKNFAVSDALRSKLKDCGIQVLDSKDGSSWRRL
ncbi:MAG: cysteine--tRNA ligase [Elusimicrobiota bacterium]